MVAGYDIVDQNARRYGGETHDFKPVKLFCSWGRATWLLIELDPEDPDIAFGLLGSIS